MSLEEFVPEIETSQWEWWTLESNKEVSEKFKEEVKKASQKSQKSHKDEKKAKKYDLLLAWFLVKIILEKKYDFILDFLFKLIDNWAPSNFILWILSLINIEISNKIRQFSNKQKINFEYQIKKEKENFNDNNLNSQIKNRINFWVEDIIDSVSIEYSNLKTKKLINLLNKKHQPIIDYTALIFIFFLKELNIDISEKKAQNISEFIIWEVEQSIKKLKIEEI